MKKSNKGETIVEVMISIVVLGMALGGAFAISNSSAKKTQANHERYQAQLYANEQAELLRSDYLIYKQTASNPRASYNPTFCSPSCTKDGMYIITITPVPTANSISSEVAKTYNINVKWPKIDDVGDYNLDLIYGL